MSLQNLVTATSGSVGAAVGIILLYPVDVVRAHLSRGVDQEGKPYRGGLDVLRRVSQEQGIKGFFGGVGVRTLQQVVQKFIFYYAYDALQGLSRTSLQVKDLPFFLQLFVGYLAGLSTVVVQTPLEVVATRLQLRVEDRRAGLAATFMKIVREEGIGTFYNGVTANMVLGVNPAIENTAFDKFKGIVLRGRVNARWLSASEAFWLGAVAKVIATALTYPYMRAKVIMQAGEPTGASKSEPGTPTVSACRSDSVAEVLLRIVNQDGVAALWSGMGLQSIRSVMASAILLATKEKIDQLVTVVFSYLLRARQARLK